MAFRHAKSVRFGATERQAIEAWASQLPWVATRLHLFKLVAAVVVAFPYFCFFFFDYC